MKLIDIIAALMGLSLLFTHQASAAPAGGGHSRPPLYEPKLADKSLATIPMKAKLVEPKFLAKISGNTADLKWEAIENATSYRVQVATDATFKWIIAEAVSQEGTSYQVTGLEKGKQYFWRVAGVKRDNDPGYIQGHFSSSSFETN